MDPALEAGVGLVGVSYYKLVPIFIERGFGERRFAKSEDKALQDSTGSVIEVKSCEFDFCCPDFESDRAQRGRR